MFDIVVPSDESLERFLLVITPQNFYAQFDGERWWIHTKPQNDDFRTGIRYTSDDFRFVVLAISLPNG